jgi:hypothetical protein
MIPEDAMRAHAFNAIHAPGRLGAHASFGDIALVPIWLRSIQT